MCVDAIGNEFEAMAGRTTDAQIGGVYGRICRGRYYDTDAEVKSWVTFDKGYFHCWGNCYEEFESGPGNYTVGIIELEDGRIIEAMPSNIHFTKHTAVQEPRKVQPELDIQAMSMSMTYKQWIEHLRISVMNGGK